MDRLRGSRSAFVLARHACFHKGDAPSYFLLFHDLCLHEQVWLCALCAFFVCCKMPKRVLRNVPCLGIMGLPFFEP